MIGCPDCGADLNKEINRLDENEYTTILDCPDCGFVIETESNLVGRDRKDSGMGPVDHYSWRQVYNACGVRGWRP